MSSNFWSVTLLVYLFKDAAPTSECTQRRMRRKNYHKWKVGLNFERKVPGGRTLFQGTIDPPVF